MTPTTQREADNFAWSHELQKRLMVVDDQGDDDLHNLLGEAACCLAALTGRPDTALTPVAAPEVPASEQQSIPMCESCDDPAMIGPDGSAGPCEACIRFSTDCISEDDAIPAATTASANFKKFDLTDYSTPVVYSNGTGRVPAPSREAAPLDELFAAIDEAQRMNHYNESSFQLGVRVARLKCLADDLRAALARAPMPAQAMNQKGPNDE